MKRLLIISMLFGLWVNAMDNGNATQLEYPLSNPKAGDGGNDPNPKKTTVEEHCCDCCASAKCCSCSIL